jgi:hypothetical protein
MILLAVLYGCETWSITLKGKSRLMMSENRLQRKIFGARREEVIKEWRKIHNEELYGLYSLPNIVRVFKSRRMRWAGHVARMGRYEVFAVFRWGNLRERGHLGDPGVDGRIILRCMFRKWDVEVWSELSWLRMGTGGGRL